MELPQQTEQTPEDIAAEEAALEAGFGGDAPAPPQEEKPAQEPEPPQEEAQPESTPEPPKTLTMDDVNAALNAQRLEHQKELQRLQDKVFGKTGELQQRIEKLNAARSEARGISPKAKDKLAAEFPELAALLFEETPAEPEPAPAPQYTPPPQVNVEEVIQRQVEPLKLAIVHPDWETVVQSADFAAWKSTLPPQEAAELETTWDSGYVAGKLTEYKAAVAKQQETAAAKAAEEAKKKERLEAAVIPTGVPRDNRPSHGADDEEAAMLDSFRRRGR